MAEAATRLLGADRASIFLWDRPNHTLVGRPALGVEGGELRIPDNAGVVGQVVQTGEPRRVGSAIFAGTAADRPPGRSAAGLSDALAAVRAAARPHDGELFGAFEVINKLDGNFTGDDEAALVELAAHAAIALENTQQIEAAAGRAAADRRSGRPRRPRSSARAPRSRRCARPSRRVADTELAVLILGENGTGKEVVSQSIHYLQPSPRQAVHRGQLRRDHRDAAGKRAVRPRKGRASPTPTKSRPGKFELAAGGTLFLDEIGDMSLGGQAKLLRVLEEKVVVRVGGCSRFTPTPA